MNTTGKITFAMHDPASIFVQILYIELYIYIHNPIYHMYIYIYVYINRYVPQVSELQAKCDHHAPQEMANRKIAHAAVVTNDF